MDTAGKKVFFLYPHSVMQEQLVEVIFQAEYEVYLLRDYRKVQPALARFRDSILFVNVDEKIPGLNWVDFVRGLMSGDDTNSARIGVLSYNEDAELARTFLMDLSVPCGYVRLRLGLKESARILLQVLEANEARGKRQHVRATVPNGMKVTLNVKRDHQYLTGRVNDISVAGMACFFDDPESVGNNEELADIQLSLRGQVVRVSGLVAGSRETAQGRLVVVRFRDAGEGNARGKIQGFVASVLRSEMDLILGT